MINKHQLLPAKESPSYGYCLSDDGLSRYPFVENLFFYNLRELRTDDKVDQSFFNQFFERSKAYEEFIDARSRNPVVDIYGAFQPFNEAFRSFLPFVAQQNEKLKDGDHILNLWDRTGYSTYLLKGLFPSCEIITVWEGNKDILGYQGFYHWLGDEEKVKVYFANLEERLPFDDNMFSLVVGLDFFHRFDQVHLLSEIDRISTEDGTAIFPHVHLTNSEPDPYFDRGCTQRHGLEYQEVFDRIEERYHRKGYVFSEPELFRLNDLNRNLSKSGSNPDSTDYNSLIAWFAEQHEPGLKSFTLSNKSSINDWRFVINPLFNIDLDRGNIYVDRKKYDSQVNYLLERHPVYVERIRSEDCIELSDQYVRFFWYARQGLTIAEISEKIGCGESEIENIVTELEEIGVATALPLSLRAIQLQTFTGFRAIVKESSERTLDKLWNHSVASFGNRVFVENEDDESEFTYNDAHEIIVRVEKQFATQKLQKGDVVLCSSSDHLEILLVFWACVKRGLVFSALDPLMVADNITSVIQELDPKIIFLSYDQKDKFSALTRIDIVLFDSENEGEFTSFSDWIEQAENDCEDIQITPNDLAVVLFTSGSTGKPKGVMLSHLNLVQSAENMVNTFNWNSEDKCLALGGLSAMSGLRNSAIATVFAGASVVVPKAKTTMKALDISDTVLQSGVTVLSVSPAILRQWVTLGDKIKNSFRSLRLLISTGNALTKSLKDDFREKFGLEIYNYYGLTETSGICIAQTEGHSRGTDIGKPVNAVVQIVDEEGNLVPDDDYGEIRIFSDGIMKGYLNHQDSEVIDEKGWFYTGDLAKRNGDGSIEIVGRRKEIIKTPGEQIVHLNFVRDILSQIAGVEDVAAESEYDMETEKIKITVVPDSNDSETRIGDAIRKTMKDKVGNQVPITVSFTDSISYNSNGKVLKQG